MADTQESETPTVAEQGEAVEETAAVTETTADTATGEQPEEPGDVQESQEKDAAPEEVQGQQTEQEGEKQAEGDAAPEQEEAAPQAAEGEGKEEEATPTVEGEATPTVEGEATGEAAAPAEGEGGEAPEGQTTGEEGEKPQTPAAAEGEQPVEGEAQKQEGEVPEGEGGEGAAVKEGGEEGEGAKETEEGKEGGDGGAESQTEGEQTPGEGQGEAAGEEKTEGATETGQEGEGEVKESDGEQTETPRGEDESKSPMPQSDTFGEGERPESSLGVGEKLSREPTPTGDQGETIQTDMLAPTTPERLASPEMGEQAHWTVHEEDEQPEFDREQLIEKYHAALTQREQLQSQNYQLQHKLAEYFRKKKADERQEYDKNVTDQEQRYLKYMAQLEDLRRQDQHERETSRLQIDELKDRCQDKKDKVDEERNKFMEFRKQVAINAINGRSGKPIPEKDIEQYLTSAMRKETEVVQVRLENIKLKNKLKKKEQQLKSKEELAEGLHLIDFEQLKIENQTYNEKIEERNEELLKLRKKITSTVQVLTHLKEKLQFVYAENHDQKGNLKEVEFHVAQRRDILSRTKQARDSLRIDNQRLRQNCGLLGNESLLRDFEERKDESDDLKDQLESLKMQHAELTLNCNQVRRKIEQARTGRQ